MGLNKRKVVLKVTCLKHLWLLCYLCIGANIELLRFFILQNTLIIGFILARLCMGRCSGRRPAWACQRGLAGTFYVAVCKVTSCPKRVHGLDEKLGTRGGAAVHGCKLERSNSWSHWGMQRERKKTCRLGLLHPNGKASERRSIRVVGFFFGLGKIGLKAWEMGLGLLELGPNKNKK